MKEKVAMINLVQCKFMSILSKNSTWFKPNLKLLKSYLRKGNILKNINCLLKLLKLVTLNFYVVPKSVSF